MTTHALDTMKPIRASCRVEPSLSERACHRMIEQEHRGMARADWLGVLFMHLEVDAEALQGQTPFELDLFDGRAFVSLVAFTMRRFRPRGTGVVGSFLCAPIARHGFLNVRTYVRHRGEAGILFLTESVNNPLSVLFGPRTYGLPYRWARLCYDHQGVGGEIHGQVRPARHQGGLRYRGRFAIDRAPTSAALGTIEEFLLERYTAFTQTAGVKRCFRIWRQPWEFRDADVQIDDRSLLDHTGAWLREARLVSAQFSPGVKNVWIGRPRKCGRKDAE